VRHLDGTEEVVRSVVDTGDYVAVTFRVGGPEDDHSIKPIVLLELPDIRTDVLEVCSLVSTWNHIVSASFLIRSNEVGVCRAVPHGVRVGAAGHSQEPAHAPWPCPWELQRYPNLRERGHWDGPWEERQRRGHGPPCPNRTQYQCEPWKHGGANQCSWSAERPLWCARRYCDGWRGVAQRAVPLLPPTRIIISLAKQTSHQRLKLSQKK